MTDAAKTAGVLFSGGQDSATVLAWALERFGHVETIGFDYGQRHDIEMQVRADLLGRIRSDFSCWADRLGDDHLVDLSGFGAISDTALTREREIDTLGSGLPNTFVPGRNLVFLTYAAAIGWRRGFADLVAGMCEADFSGYPDCRKDTLDKQMEAISMGLDRDFILHTPLMHRSKAQAWQLAGELGGDALVELIRTGSHTCYVGERGALHAWGYGCGACPACELRAQGWTEFAQP
ncbi:7-cyano-7-deazaguanine synthase QueC [uncultured Algimonas sp.]|uniref:7-cyano-7-deazaguanine synthase QueC n=1 Tax=uncultured Algimonas sp. TaxID=1547920 RepID=UPI00262A29DA|nr:7-cyano-7-deazaguanine synthase QueC [uncultured Algimonas sp.]